MFQSTVDPTVLLQEKMRTKTRRSFYKLNWAFYGDYMMLVSLTVCSVYAGY